MGEEENCIKQEKKKSKINHKKVIIFVIAILIIIVLAIFIEYKVDILIIEKTYYKNQMINFCSLMRIYNVSNQLINFYPCEKWII